MVRIGGKIKPSHTKKAPMVRIACPNANDVKGFTVALTDPDAPSRKEPEWSEMCHWIVIIPSSGNSMQDGEEHWDEIQERPKEIIECTSLRHFPSLPFPSLPFLSFPLLCFLFLLNHRGQCLVMSINDINRQTAGTTLQNWLSPLRLRPSGRR